MAQHRSVDARDQADTNVLRNNITYSLAQLRLIGLLCIAVVLAQLGTLALALTGAGLEQRLEALLHFCPWLLLLPFGIALYLLGGGHHRLRREFPLLEVTHHSLLPLGLACLLLLPALTTHDWIRLRSGRQQADMQWREIQQKEIRREEAPSIPSPVAPAPQPLSPYQRRLFDSRSLLSADLMAVLAGVGLMLLHHQSRREIARHRLTPRLFFRTSPASRHRRPL